MIILDTGCNSSALFLQYFVYIWIKCSSISLNLVPHIKVRKEAETLWEQDAEDDIWAPERGSKGRLEKIT